MPLAFPSHQGLIIPLARRWPAAFDALALCVGAAMPDVIDGATGLWHGRLGQSWGHSLIGVVLLCWPVGMLVTAALAAADARWWKPRVPAVPAPAGLAAVLGRLRALLARVAAPASGAPPIHHTRPALFVAWSISVIVGALSHIAFDAISHEHCYALLPWHGPITLFGPRWTAAWFSIPLPLYDRPYPFGLHTVSWCLLTIIGAAMFFWPAMRRRVVC